MRNGGVPQITVFSNITNNCDIIPSLIIRLNTIIGKTHVG